MERVPLSVIFDNSIRRISSQRISYLSNELGLQFRQAVAALDLEDIWSIDNAISIEVKKSVLRSQLRYSRTGLHLASEVAVVLTETFFDLQKSTFYTPLYPMIHIAGDKAEAGMFHTDQIGNLKLKTGWTAITNYEYDALSFVPFGLLGDALCRRILRTPLNPGLGFPIRATRGEVLTWGGGFYHRGNLNSSNETACAVVIRVTDRPLFLEPSRRTQVGELSLEKSTPSSFVNIALDLNNLTHTIHALIEWANKIDYLDINDNLCGLIYAFLCEKDCLLSPKISFALSLIAQRIRTVENIFYSETPKANLVSYILDLMSLLAGAENLSSLQNINVSVFSCGLTIVDQIEDLLSASLVPKTQAWAIVLGREVSERQQVWSF